MKGVMQIRLNKPSEALPFFQKALKQIPEDKRTLIHLGKTLSLMGIYERAAWFLHRAHDISPLDITIYLHLVENSIRAHDDRKREQLVDEMFDIKAYSEA